MIRFSSLVVVCSLWAAAPAMADDARDIVGTWEVQRLEVDGIERPDAVPYRIQFARSYINFAKAPMTKFRYVETTKPKQIDMGWIKLEMSGIYELQGDTLWICFNLAEGQPRPTEFKTNPGENRNMLTCRRVR